MVKKSAKKNKFPLWVLILVIVAIIIFIGFSLIPSPVKEDYRKNYPADADNFIGDSVYENTYYNFRLTYPNGSIFAHAHPEKGFVVRFFLPNGQTIANDQENIGVYILENFSNTQKWLDILNRSYANYGPIEVKEIVLGGQKGYKVEFTSEYTFSKGTREMMYFTVRNSILYDLNYFPVVNESRDTVDNIASSFEFTR